MELYLEGQTTIEEERTIGRLLRCHDLPADLVCMRDMFAGFEALANETDARSIDSERLSDHKPSEEKALSLNTGKRIELSAHSKRRIGMLWTALSSVAAAAIVTLILVIALEPRPTVYGYINGEPITDMAMMKQQTDNVLDIFTRAVSCQQQGLDALESCAESMATVTSAAEWFK